MKKPPDKDETPSQPPTEELQGKKLTSGEHQKKDASVNKTVSLNGKQGKYFIHSFNYY